MIGNAGEDCGSITEMIESCGNRRHDHHAVLGISPVVYVEEGLANLWSGKKTTKKVHAGLRQEIN
jgi:hypothetical protein